MYPSNSAYATPDSQTFSSLRCSCWNRTRSMRRVSSSSLSWLFFVSCSLKRIRACNDNNRKDQWRNECLTSCLNKSNLISKVLKIHTFVGMCITNIISNTNILIIILQTKLQPIVSNSVNCLSKY